MIISATKIALLRVLFVATYAWSLFLPAFISHLQDPEVVEGYRVLQYGWMGLFFLDVRWLANIFFIICLFDNFTGFWHRIAALSGIVLVIASFYLPIYIGHQDHLIAIDSLGLGAYIWAASLVGIFVPSVFFAKGLINDRTDHID